MAVVGVTMVKDEEDVIEGTLLHLVEEGLDRILVADNGSTDGTGEILLRLRDEYPQIELVTDTEPGYYQSKKMTRLAAQAANDDDWVVPFDADEIWYAHADRLAVVLDGLGRHVRVVQVALYNHFATLLDDVGESPFERMIYRQREPARLPKVCFRWSPEAVIHQGNHGVDLIERSWAQNKMVQVGVELRHFPYRSYEQFRRKAFNGRRAYEATDLSPDQGAHWREYGAILERGGDEALREVFERWFYFTAPSTGDLVLDPAPFRRWR